MKRILDAVLFFLAFCLMPIIVCVVYVILFGPAAHADHPAEVWTDPHSRPPTGSDRAPNTTGSGSSSARPPPPSGPLITDWPSGLFVLSVPRGGGQPQAVLVNLRPGQILEEALKTAQPLQTWHQEGGWWIFDPWWVADLPYYIGVAGPDGEMAIYRQIAVKDRWIRPPEVEIWVSVTPPGDAPYTTFVPATRADYAYQVCSGKPGDATRVCGKLMVKSDF